MSRENDTKKRPKKERIRSYHARIPGPVYEALVEAAEEMDRSINWYLVQSLREKLNRLDEMTDNVDDPSFVPPGLRGIVKV